MPHFPEQGHVQAYLIQILFIFLAELEIDDNGLVVVDQYTVRTAFIDLVSHRVTVENGTLVEEVHLGLNQSATRGSASRLRIMSLIWAGVTSLL